MYLSECWPGTSCRPYLSAARWRSAAPWARCPWSPLCGPGLSIQCITWIHYTLQVLVTFDVLVVATVARLLTQVLTLLGNISYLESLHIAMALLLHLLAGDEGSDGDAVLLAHHTLGRRLVHLGGAQ